MLTCRAAEPVWALVSGLPRGEREERLFMVLQAYIDDTGNSPNEYAFILSGFVAPSEVWAKFCDEWQALLDRWPGADYLKTAHAYSLNVEFHKKKGWTRSLRDKFMMDAADIIRTHIRERVAVWARREHFDKHLATLALPFARDAAEHPYFLCFYHLILSVAALHSLGKPEPCDFIFDEQSKLGQNALNWWGMFKQNAKDVSNTDFTPFLGSPPTFRDEKTFKPLQAADFYAWHLRKRIWENKVLHVPAPKPLLRLGMMSQIEYEFTESKIIELRDFIAAFGQRFAAANPGIPLSAASTMKRARAKWFPSGI
jgi:hypothetical protein